MHGDHRFERPQGCRDAATVPPRGRRNTWGGPAFVSQERPQGCRDAATVPPRGRRNTWDGPAFVSHKALASVGLGLALALASLSAAAQYSSPMRDVENPDRSPYAEVVSVTIDPPFVNNFAFLPTPAGKRVMLDYATLLCNTPSTTDQISVATLNVTKQISPTSSQGFAAAVLLPERRAGVFSGAQWADSRVVKGYSDPVRNDPSGGNGISINIFHTESTVSARCTVSVSGHLFTP
jgi:hypothetical protein